MPTGKTTACAHANIAFIKYWGNRDATQRIPLNDSISMNLDHATTTTTVAFDDRLERDQVNLADAETEGAAYDRVVAHLDRVRALAKIETKARVKSINDFPTGAGMTSSASGFAALSLAAARAAGLNLGERELTILARKASGSACRSIPDGFVEWIAGTRSEDSHAVSLAPASHWDLNDVVAIVSAAQKQVGSTEGHAAASSSLFLSERLRSLPARFHRVRRAILAKDLQLLGPAIEEDAIELHFIAMTSRPPIYYWMPGMVHVIQAMQHWRRDGLAVYFTLDAGPNVHLICESKDAARVAELAGAVPTVERVIVNSPGGGARTVDRDLF